MSLSRFKLWLKFGTNGFWANRADIYRDIAESIEGKELLRDFIIGESVIASTPHTLNKARAAGLGHMRSIMDGGEFSLPDILIATMPSSDHMALGVLRQSPDKVEALRNLAQNVDEQKALNKLIMKSMVSPILLLPVGFVFAYVLSSVSIPEFVKTAPPEVWTGFNYAVRVSAETFSKFGPAVFGIIVFGVMWWLSWGLANFTPQWRYIAESATGTKKILWNFGFPFRPALQIYRDISGTKFLSDLSFLLKSGMLLQDAISVMAQDATPWMRNHLIRIVEYMRLYPGDHIGAFSQGVLSQHLAGKLHSAVRRDTGRFAHVLIGIGSKGQKEAQESLGRTMTQLSAILLAVVLSVILFFYGGQAVIIKSIEEANSPAAVMKRERAKKQQQSPQPPMSSRAQKN